MEHNYVSSLLIVILCMKELIKIMKILIVTDKLYPDEIGGSCTYSYETALGLSNLNNEVVIFTGYPDKIKNDVFFENIKVYRLFDKKNIIKSSKYLLEVMEKYNFDRVIIHSPLSWLVYHLASRRLVKRPIELGVYHGPWYREAFLKYSSNRKIFHIGIVPIMKTIEYLYLNNINNYVFLSNYMKDEILRINPRRKNEINYKIIPGGVNLKKYSRKYSKQEARRKLGISEDAFVIFSLRRLEYRMGLHNAIKSMKYLIDSVDKEWLYILGGKGPYESQLKKIALEEKVPCRFEGFISSEDLNTYFCASDLFLVPSIDLEGFGLVILESLAMGLPVLVTPQGGMKELEDKFKHLYVSEGFSAKEIAKKILEISSDLKINSSFKEEMEYYDWKNISLLLNKYLHEL